MIEFIEVFGQRFIGLIDDQNVYTTYRVPYPEAPYPQDYIIDQQGIVRYWSDEYDPQEIMRVIDGLLATVIEERSEETLEQSEVNVVISPNPSRGAFTLSVKGVTGFTGIRIYDTLGRVVFSSEGYITGIADMHLDLPAGCYVIDIDCEGERYTDRFAITK
ncbi:MAG: T9SS type A sorting domain-containing protein [candidate division WOR-3 bacterium]|nr:MAG: T9SS type A sorting domain-containing protein [candidate division WOR-3 bacterium]